MVNSGMRLFKTSKQKQKDNAKKQYLKLMRYEVAQSLLMAVSHDERSPIYKALSDELHQAQTAIAKDPDLVKIMSDLWETLEEDQQAKVTHGIAIESPNTLNANYYLQSNAFAPNDLLAKFTDKQSPEIQQYCQRQAAAVRQDAQMSWGALMAATRDVYPSPINQKAVKQAQKHCKQPVMNALRIMIAMLENFESKQFSTSEQGKMLKNISALAYDCYISQIQRLDDSTVVAVEWDDQVDGGYTSDNDSTAGLENYHSDRSQQKGRLNDLQDMMAIYIMLRECHKVSNNEGLQTQLAQVITALEKNAMDNLAKTNPMVFQRLQTKIRQGRKGVYGHFTPDSCVNFFKLEIQNLLNDNPQLLTDCQEYQKMLTTEESDWPDYFPNIATLASVKGDYSDECKQISATVRQQCADTNSRFVLIFKRGLEPENMSDAASTVSMDSTSSGDDPYDSPDDNHMDVEGPEFYRKPS